MPALLTTVAAFQRSALGQALTESWSTLADGALDEMLVQACDTAETFCDRHLATPPVVTLASSASHTDELSVESAVNIHSGDVVVFSDGHTSEVQGAEITDYTDTDYPGTIYLNEIVTGPYSGTIHVYRQDQYTVRGRRVGEGGDWEGMPVSLSQIRARNLYPEGSSRRIFLREYPLWSLYAAYQTYDWSTEEVKVSDLSEAQLKRSEGIVVLPIGTVNPKGSVWRTQYVAGYRTIPGDIRDAVHLYLADAVIRSANPLGAVMLKTRDQAVHFTRNTQTTGSAPPASLNVEAAEAKLESYRRRS